MRDDPAVRAMYEETEEGKKVARLGGQKFFAVFERLPDDEIIRSPLDELWSQIESVTVFVIRVQGAELCRTRTCMF